MFHTYVFIEGAVSYISVRSNLKVEEGVTSPTSRDENSIDQLYYG